MGITIRGLRRPVVLMGPPGGGKGTQAQQLAGRYGVPHISTGEMFREHVRQGTELGRRARAIMDRGDLVPDDIVVAMIEERIAQPDCAEGFVLDGFPRTVPQAQTLEALLHRTGRPDPVIVLIEVDPSALLRRLTGRRVCKACGEIYNIYDHPPKAPGRCDFDGGELVQRDDDRVEVIEERLVAYREQTEPVFEYFHGHQTVVVLDGGAPPEAVTRALIETVDREEAHDGHL